MENVERAASSVAYQSARKIFKTAGYGLSEAVLDASFYNVPQRRKRFFCVGKIDEGDSFLNLAEGNTEKALTVREYFSDDLTIDHYYRHPRSYLRRGIFSVDEPSPTIRGVNRPISPQYIRHEGDTEEPNKVSPLSLEQRAQIQTFPKNFIWEGTKTACEQMIGNAVPVNLANHIATKIMNFERRYD